MEMKLRFGTNEIIIASISPSDTSLTFSVLSSNVTFDQLKELQTYSDKITYLEDDVVIVEYENYTQDFKCTYISESYIVELLRISEENRQLLVAKDKISKLEVELLNAQLAIIELNGKLV